MKRHGLHPIPGRGQGNSLENSLRAVVISSSVTAGSPAPGAVLGTRDNLPGKHREQLRVFAQVFMPNSSPLDVYRTPAARQRLYGLPWGGERKGDARVGSEGGGAALFGGTLPRDSGEPPRAGQGARSPVSASRKAGLFPSSQNPANLKQEQQPDAEQAVGKSGWEKRTFGCSAS